MYLTNIIKPTHICNLACKYCFNEDTRAPIMNEATLRRVVEQTFAYITLFPQPWFAAFIWHGGEPLVAKLDFYKKAVEYQKTYNNGVFYQNTIQTNGLLLNDEWLQFIKENQFNLSISIDGTKSLHDANRIYNNGKGSFDNVMQKIQLVKKSGVPFGVCVVISKQTKDHAAEIYDFLASEKLHFNVIPMTKGGDAINCYEDIGLDAEEYADPWITMFDKWFYSKEDNYVYCSDFGAKSAAILSGSPTDCIGQQYCARNNVSTDPDGNVYPCATLSSNLDWYYGNINSSDLQTLMKSKPAEKAQNRKEDPHCTECKWRHVCHGGCLSRAIKFYGTVDTRDYYCPSLYRIYEHIETRVRSQDKLGLTALPKEGTTEHRQTPAMRQVIEKTFKRPSPKEAKISLQSIKQKGATNESSKHR